MFFLDCSKRETCSHLSSSLATGIFAVAVGCMTLDPSMVEAGGQSFPGTSLAVPDALPSSVTVGDSFVLTIESRYTQATGGAPAPGKPYLTYNNDALVSFVSSGASANGTMFTTNSAGRLTAGNAPAQIELQYTNVTFNALAAGTVTFQGRETSSNPVNWKNFGTPLSITILPVPEPGTYALMGSMLLVAGLNSRRKQSALKLVS